MVDAVAECSDSTTINVTTPQEEITTVEFLPEVSGQDPRSQAHILICSLVVHIPMATNLRLSFAKTQDCW